MAGSPPAEAQAAATPAPQMAVGAKSRIVVVLGAMIALFVAALDQTVVSTAIPSIVADLGGLDLLPWVFTSYMLTSTIAVPIAGKLGDQFGRKPLFLAGLAIFFASSLGAGAAQSMEQLVLVRGIQGVGGGVIMTTSFAVIADLYSPLERGKVTGLVSGTFGLASVIGPVAGGALTEAISWRWIFYVNLPIIAVAFLVVLVVVPFMRTSSAKPKIDMIGAVLLANMMVPLLLALVWGGNRYAWDSL
ncbi:MAG: MFS transporter, partial [Dehalococcoidia bacterium]